MAGESYFTKWCGSETNRNEIEMVVLDGKLEFKLFVF
jgi:hypothetical protein